MLATMAFSAGLHVVAPAFPQSLFCASKGISWNDENHQHQPPHKKGVNFFFNMFVPEHKTTANVSSKLHGRERSTDGPHFLPALFSN